MTGDQFYVTHCGTADSVLGAPGFSVRAASVPAEDADALRRALKYPPYELPLEMWKGRPARADAPRRLARTRHPAGGVWAAHAAYLETDTMGRDRSYFAHLLHLPAADPAAVLRSWDAPGWATDYPRGAGKTLPRGGLAAGTAVSDDALAAFLSDEPQNGSTELSVTACPARLRASAGARRDLAARFLQALVLTGQVRGRDRLFVHAEPGLVALLLYAAVRLLPPPWTANLTFSTFEPYHRGIQDYKLATVVGTYLGAPGKGLDADLVSARGFGLDTFLPDHSSAELSGPLTPGVTELLDLAAGGDWALLADVHRSVGAEGDALARVKVAVSLTRGVARLNRGEPTVDDLLALRADPRGAEALARAADGVWPYVRAAALADGRVRAAFRDWLARPDRLDEFRRDATKALARGDVAAWDGRWAVVRDAAAPDIRKAQLDKVLKRLDEHLPSLGYHARGRLRGACADCGAWPPHHLLAPTSVEEFTVILSDPTPAEWRGYACLAVMGPDERNWLAPVTAPSRDALRARAREFLFGAPPEALAAYARAARPHLDTDPVLLLGLFQPYAPACRPLMGRLLRANALEPGDWVKLVQAVNLYAGDWDGFLLDGDHLARLLVALGGDGVGRDVWTGYLDELSPALLSPALAPPDADGATVHAWERAVHAHLRRAAGELGAAGAKLVPALPPGGAGRLLAANDLVQWVDDPGSAATLPDPTEVARACRAFGVAPPDLVRAAYLRGGFAGLELPRDAAALAPLVALFRACFPTDLDVRRSSTAVTQWLALSDTCPDGTRAAFQAHLVCECVPQVWHRDILEEPRHVRFLPAADARIRDALAAPPGPFVTDQGPPADGAADIAFEAAPTKSRGRGSGSWRRRRVSNNGGVWVVAVVVVIFFAAVAGAVVLLQTLGAGKPKDADPPPAQAEKDDKPKAKEKGKAKDVR